MSNKNSFSILLFTLTLNIPINHLLGPRESSMFCDPLAVPKGTYCFLVNAVNMLLNITLAAFTFDIQHFNTYITVNKL